MPGLNSTIKLIVVSILIALPYSLNCFEVMLEYFLVLSLNFTVIAQNYLLLVVEHCVKTLLCLN